MSGFLAGDPVLDQVERFVGRIEAGEEPRDIENEWIDAKEEAGRRTRTGEVLAGGQHNEKAASQLAREIACMANTLRGGAVLVGIGDRGEAIGTELDVSWLRHRILDLTQRELLPAVDERVVKGVRCLVLRTNPAANPVMVGGRVVMRVDEECVDVPATEWLARRVETGYVDISLRPSDRTVEDVSPVSVELAQGYLREAGDAAARELAELRMGDLLARLGAVTHDGYLTRGAALLFTGADRPAFDFQGRDTAGGSTGRRVERADVSVLQQFAEIDQAIRLSLPTFAVEAADGPTVGQFSALPVRARREALVNAIGHRDWLATGPVHVELIGSTLRVTSPGTFVGGVTPDNIITHPSARRSPHLTELLQKLRLAEREAVGVDRMYLDMIAQGHPAPDFVEDGDSVRVVLLGGHPDVPWIRAVASIQPRSHGQDLNCLLLLDHLHRVGFADAATAGPVLQRSTIEAQDVLDRLETSRMGGVAAVVRVGGQPSGTRPAYRPARLDVGPRRHSDRPEARRRMLRRYARARGRISSTEAMDLTGRSRPTVLGDLEHLTAEGELTSHGGGSTSHFRPG